MRNRRLFSIGYPNSTVEIDYGVGGGGVGEYRWACTRKLGGGGVDLHSNRGAPLSMESGGGLVNPPAKKRKVGTEDREKCSYHFAG